MLYKHDGHQMSLWSLENFRPVCLPCHPCGPSWPHFAEQSWDRASMIEDRAQRPEGQGEFARCGTCFSLALPEPHGQSQLPGNAVSKGPLVFVPVGIRNR